MKKRLTLIGSIGVLSLTVISCGDDLLGKYHPAECQEVVFEPPSGILSFYNDKSAPRLLAANSPCAPTGTTATPPTKLFVADTGNNRVLVFDISTITDGENAENVLGAADFTTNDNATTQSDMNFPNSVAIDSANNRLFVTGNQNHRVMVFDVTAITDGENAVNVLGQANFTSGGANITQSGMSFPQSVAYDATNSRLFEGEGTASARVMVYDVTAITDGENAVNVLGKANFTTGGAETTQSGIWVGSAVAYDGTNNRLFIADGPNNRVLVFDTAAITNGENAVNVLGQASFTTSAGATTQSGMRFPQGLVYDATNNRLFVADATNNRILVFDVSAITDGENAINVLGQANFTTSAGATTQSRLNNGNASELAYDSVNQYLYVTDTDTNRVLVFDVASITDGENAIHVLGQANFTSSAAAITQSRMQSPEGLALK